MADIHRTHVALLRGINVNPTTRIGMAMLREVFESLGYHSVVTLLQSGNVIFASSQPVDAHAVGAINAAIERSTGVSSRAVVLTDSDFRAIAARNPLRDAGDDLSRIIVTFVDAPLDLAALAAPPDEDLASERLVVTSGALYQWCPDGVLKSKVPAAFWRGLPVLTTARNVRTVDRILGLLDSRSPRPE